MLVTNPVRCKMARRAPTHLKRFIVELFLVPDLRAGNAAVQLDELNVMGLTELHVESWVPVLGKVIGSTGKTSITA